MILSSSKVFASLLFILGVLTVAPAQSSSASTSDWETLRPEGEEFSVLMPKGSTFDASKQPYHKMELNTRMYISSSQGGGPVFAVVALSGIKSNPAMYTEAQRLNSYVDAFKNLFSAKIRPKTAVARLTLLGDKTLQGHAGREYRMTLGDLSGMAQVYATRKRFYAIAYLNSKKDDSIQDQFMSSFVLPEKITEPPATVASQNPAAVPNTVQPATKASGEAPSSDTANANADAKPGEQDQAAAPQSGKRRPISGGVLNGKAISLPKPEYPAEAKAAGASGTVAVQVIVDEAGNVIEAHAVSGNPLLHQASVNAALQARFSPTSLMGEAVKVTGVITYNFVRQ